MNSQVFQRRFDQLGLGDSLETITVYAPGSMHIANDGSGVCYPLHTIIDQFELLPVVTTVVATSDKFQLLLGTNTPVATQSTTAGVTLTTGGTNTNQAAVAGILNTGLSVALSTTNGVKVSTRINMPSLTGAYYSAGINSLATDVNPMATGGDGAALLADPGNALTATTGATGAQALNWIICYKVGGVNTYAFTSLPLVALQDQVIAFVVNADYTVGVFLNSVLIGTSPVLTAGAVVKPIAGVRTTATATAAVDIRFTRLSKLIG